MIGALIAAATLYSAPLRIVHHLPFVQARIAGGKPLWFLIDTGTDPSVIDLALARKLRLRLSKPGTGTGGGTDNVQLFGTRLPGVAVGGFTERGTEALAADLSSLRSALKFPFGGVLGYSFLNHHAVQIDYANRRLRIWPAGNVRTSSRCTYSTPFTYAGDVIVQSARVNGRPALANLDTGSTGMLAFTPAAVEKLHLTLQALHARTGTGEGYNGRYASREGSIAHFAIGAVRYKNIPATFWTPHTGHDSRPWDVNVGGGILAKLAPLFDYIRHVVYFKTC